MKIYIYFLLILIGPAAHADALNTSTEAGTAFCLTCSDPAPFIKISSEQIRQLDAVMANKSQTKDIEFDLANLKPTPPSPQKEKQIEKDNDRYRLPLSYTDNDDNSNQRNKVELIYLPEDDETTQIQIGLNRNSHSYDPSNIQQKKKNPKILGIKYIKRFRTPR